MACRQAGGLPDGRHFRLYDVIDSDLRQLLVNNAAHTGKASPVSCRTEFGPAASLLGCSPPVGAGDEPEAMCGCGVTHFYNDFLLNIKHWG